MLLRLPNPLDPTPYTLHPTPYTLHPAPYTLHPSPHTPHPTSYTLHPTPFTLHPTPYTLHPTPTPYNRQRGGARMILRLNADRPLYLSPSLPLPQPTASYKVWGVGCGGLIGLTHAVAFGQPLGTHIRPYDVGPFSPGALGRFYGLLWSIPLA